VTAVFCAEKQQPPEPADLYVLSKSLPASEGRYKLVPEWVGTVKRVHLRGGESIYKADEPENIRLTHAWISTPRESKGAASFLKVARLSKSGSYMGREAPIFMEKLPSSQEVAAMTADNLRKAFGNQHGFTDAWGGPNGLNWTEGWTYFTFESPIRIRFMHVFAHLEGQPKMKNPEIRIMEIREGYFRPANPASDEEKAKFKTAEELEVIEEAKRRAGLAKFPEPLRSLLDERNRPGDSELAGYEKAINAVRARPDEKLIGQLVAALADDGTTEIEAILKDIYSAKPIGLTFKPWLRPQRTLAQRFLVNSLREAKSTLAFERTLGTLLESFGGGTIQLRTKDDARIDVTVKMDARRLEYGSGSSNITPKNLSDVITATQEYILKQHPELRPKQEMESVK
jgi:hypothetical protein